MARTKSGDVGCLAVLLADAIVGVANLRRLDLDFDLLASGRDVNKFSFHFVLWCERGDSNPHTFRYQILSLARLPIPPLSPAKSAVKNSTEVQQRINAPSTFVRYIAEKPLLTSRAREIL